MSAQHGTTDGRPHAHTPGHTAGHAAAPGHRHGHNHGDQVTDLDWEDLATHLEENGELQLPVLRRTAARLSELFAPGHKVRRILDIGSGPGVMTCALAEAFPDAEVVAVDGAPGLLDRALARADRLGLRGRVSVRHAELPEGLSDGESAEGEPRDGGLGSADLIWSSKAVHHLGDQQDALTALTGLLRPGGVLAVAEGGLPMRFLPRDIGIGSPGLQARLDVAQEYWFEVMRSGLPGSVSVVEDWPAMFGRAGLGAVGNFTTLLDLPAPLGATARAYLHTQLARLSETTGESLDPEDRATLALLVDPDSPEGILRRPDAFLLSATTVFTGVRPAR
jgi:SAM-dependent methyltransferase